MKIIISILFILFVHSSYNGYGQTKSKTDSVKVTYHKYLIEKRKGTVDSLNPYYKKLMHKK